MMIIRLLIINLFFLNVFCLNSQTASVLVPQSVKGVEAFEKGDYLLSSKIFKDLLGRYPKDPMYHFYLGASLVMSNIDVSQGIELLRFASVRNVPNDVYYYLGLAYFRQYYFEEAVSLFQQFRDEASITQLKKTNVNQEIAKIKEIIPLMKTITVPQVIAKQIESDSLCLARVLHSSSGSFSSCVGLFAGCQRMFVPASMKPNDYLFFSAVTNRLRGAEIFRVQLGANGNWGTPENIGSVINTAKNEINPIYDEKTKILYFASDGLGGYGGYDVFSSRFDTLKKTWSKPINMDFPMNSPYDETFFFKDSQTGISSLISNRESQIGLSTIYRFTNDKIFSIESVNNPIQLSSIAKLTVNAPEKELMQYTRTSSLNEIKKEPVQVAKIEKQIEKKSMANSHTAYESSYHLSVFKALGIQMTIDSIYQRTDALWLLVPTISDDTERGTVQKEIIALNTHAKTLQAEADKQFAKLREHELEMNHENKELATEAKSDGVINTLDNALVFEILAVSPYSINNPIQYDLALPSGILYRIQLASFTKTVAEDYFKGMKPITGETINNNTAYKYYAGWFSKYSEATTALKLVQSQGFKDAFIVAYYKGEKLPVARAREME